jgi:SAM-dependent methyltransferase
MEQQLANPWGRGDAYEQYVGRWSRRIAPLFLDWLGMPPGRGWLDVGCGTGALSAAILDRCAPAAVTGVEPSEGFLATARENLAGRAELLPGSATAIPLPDDAVDVAVCGLVLNFVADQPAALAELARVVRPGGAIAAYVWDYSGTMEMMSLFWEAAAALDPRAVPLREAVRFQLSRPEELESLFAGAGLAGVATTGIEIETRFADFDDYWRPFLGGAGPAPTYVMSLDEDDRERLRARLRDSLPFVMDGSIPLMARAWAVRGSVPEDTAP